MKKTTLFLFSLFLTIGAMAQVNYTPNFTGVKTRTNRMVGSISVGNDTYTMPAYSTDVPRYSYTDLTGTKTFTVSAGTTVSLGMTQSDGSWMNAFVYVDMDNNGFTAGIANDNYTPTDDLVSSSFFNQGYTDDENGRNSAGTSITGDPRSTLALPDWTVPADLAPGEYRIRFKYDWCNINPAGDEGTYFNNTFVGHGGEIIDAKLVVVGEYAHNTGNINRNDRGLTSFTITDGKNSLTVNSIQTSAQAPVYVDKSAQKLTTKQGATLKFTEFNYTGSWMHAYAYIDYNKDLEFNLTNNNDGEGEGEIVSYNYYEGNDITGITANQGSAMGNTYGYGESKAMPAFTLPRTLPAGEYRVRIKIDWNNLDAAYGASDIAANGGCQCDFTIVVEEAVGNEIARNALNNAVGEAIALFNAVKIGTSVGSYSSSIDGYEAEFNDIVSYNSSITEGTPSDEIDEKTARVREIIASFSLNMPKAGDYIRIKSIEAWNDDARYLGAQNSTVETSRAEFVAEAGANTIFYFDGDNLVSYASGNYLVNNIVDNSSFLGYNGVQADGTVIEFRTSNNTSNRHAYNISFKDNDAKRWLYTNKDNYTDAGSDCGTEGGYNFNLEPVTELPVTITAAGYATFFAPVAVNATGVKAYTVAINGKLATLTEIEGGVIPANTGVVLEAAENSYNLAITTTDATATSALEGTVAATYIRDNAYVLGYIKVDGEDVVGFGTAIKNQEGNTSWKNNSHKAYLPASEVPAGAAFSAGFRFSFGGTTAVEDVEIENEREEIYDLTGRRLNEITKPGIYIINGKKVLVK